MVTQICEVCSKEFTYELKVGYPRKYCPVCSAVKKAEYANKDKSGVPQNNTAFTDCEKIVDGHQCGLMSQRDITIIAQCMTKCACYGRKDVTIEKALEMYHEAVLSLEQNG